MSIKVVISCDWCDTKEPGRFGRHSLTIQTDPMNVGVRRDRVAFHYCDECSRSILRFIQSSKVDRSKL